MTWSMPISLQDSGAFDSGDFVDLGHEYTEPLQRYDAGLFYPICIVKDTYCIVHKLRLWRLLHCLASP
jgi:hypothetical protein